MIQMATDAGGLRFAFSTDSFVVVPGEHADALLSAIRQDAIGNDARIIGTVVSDHPGRVVMETAIGGERIVDMPTGTPLPRIC